MNLANTCDTTLTVDTDLTLRIQRDDSSHASKVVYYRLDTKKQETFWFNVKTTDHTRLEFDGTNLVCKASSRSPQCNQLQRDKPVKVLLVSVDINPRKGKAHKNQWIRNRYNIKGSYTKITCENCKSAIDL